MMLRTIRIIITGFIIFFSFIIYKAGEKRRKAIEDIKKMEEEFNTSVVRDSITINGRQYENRSKDYQ